MPWSNLPSAFQSSQTPGFVATLESSEDQVLNGHGLGALHRAQRSRLLFEQSRIDGVCPVELFHFCKRKKMRAQAHLGHHHFQCLQVGIDRQQLIKNAFAAAPRPPRELLCFLPV